ncbi:zinc finger CCCH domain-containing protein 16 isoform X3 [Citrus clementina]|uniref:zinc finger CCCH domain-containing protein 16 isoform X3 n=1 Tax=Citrus clementina TaxID=85681 RepID=UPI000CED5010|nr:zinc finger CCCH domain-containing protein 16 isoform X3 [Citrus x clementina]
MMPYKKKDLCRNFQRGSCQYGERCKFLHVTQQQPNPFGFGVQNNPQSKGTNNYNFGNKQNQSKPFENKWTRFSPITGGGVPASRQPDNQPQSANHKCSDPDSCKRIIAEDFELERPLWKLTCYGHWKNIEAKEAEWDFPRKVERERNLLNSNLMKFDNLLRNPYTGPCNSALSGQSPFAAASPNAFSPTPQDSTAPSLSSFNQVGSLVNMGFGTRPSTPSNNAFGQPSSFPNSSQTSSAFGTNNFPSASGGLFDNQFPPAQAIRSPFTSGMTSLSNNGVVGFGSNKISTPIFATHNPLFGNQSSIPSGGPVSTSTAAEQATTNIQMVKNLQNGAVLGDTSVWLKVKWIPGEIPEEAPPDAFV